MNAKSNPVGLITYTDYLKNPYGKVGDCNFGEFKVCSEGLQGLAYTLPQPDRAAKGKIWIESAEGEGTAFLLNFQPNKLPHRTAGCPYTPFMIHLLSLIFVKRNMRKE
ncbi:hypothetical protein ACVWYN_002090 [Pedobacter sp. UYP24]